jgi:hypothetical protein
MSARALADVRLVSMVAHAVAVIAPGGAKFEFERCRSRLSLGANILIPAKEIIGIVFPLDPLEPCIGFSSKGIANKMLSLAMAGKVQIQRNLPGDNLSFGSLRRTLAAH